VQARIEMPKYWPLSQLASLSNIINTSNTINWVKYTSIATPSPSSGLVKRTLPIMYCPKIKKANVKTNPPNEDQPACASVKIVDPMEKVIPTIEVGIKPATIIFVSVVI
jgi:hypothetical protein